MQAIAGWALIGVSVLAYLYGSHVSEGQVSYVMVGPAIFGARLVYQHWRDT
jgi:hypothetical protein